MSAATLTPDERQEIVRLYSLRTIPQPWTMQALADKFNVSAMTVFYHVDKDRQAEPPAPGYHPHLNLEEPPRYNYLDPWLEGEP